MVLHTSFYQHSELQDIYDNMETVVDYFCTILNGNDFDYLQVRTKFEMLYKHIWHLKANSKLSNCWPVVFQLRSKLGVINVSLLGKICLMTSLVDVKNK